MAPTRASRRSALLALAGWIALPALAANPMDMERVRRQAKRIHANYMEEISRTIGQPVAYLNSYLPGGANAGKKLSEELDLSAKQYRAVNRLIAQRNYAIREAYMDAGLAIPKHTDIHIL